jgi:two-component system, NtrC family, sensor kinase
VNGDVTRLVRCLVIGRGPTADRAVTELRSRLDGVEVVPAVDVTAAREATGDDPAAIPLVLVVPDADRPAGATIDELGAGGSPLARAAVLLVTDQGSHDDLSAAVDGGRLAGVVAGTWRDGALAGHAGAQLRRTVLGSPEHAAVVAPPGGFEPVSELLRDLELDDHTIALRCTEALDQALGRRPRLQLEPGTRLTRQDVEVNGVFVVRSGAVALDRRTPVGELRLHHRSTGPVVGLLSLAQQQRAFFTARATTPVEVLHLTVEQLDEAIRRSPAVGAALGAGAVRALASRLRRAEQLQVEKRQLNAQLEAEQRRLAEAYEALEGARLELVEQARFATLGELAAGVAHELNNPVAALRRAASHVAEDVDALLGDHPAEPTLRATVDRHRRRPAPRPAEERAARRRLQDALGDAELARRLVAAGVTDVDDARRLVDDPGRLAGLERAAALGSALRNLEVGSQRVAELVASLRSYARPDAAPVEGVDVHEGIDDTLRLVAHQLEGVEVVRRYGDLPTIRARPGPLGQVWTNLLVNAADALAGRGRIEVRTDRPDEDHVRVRIADDGPGMPAEVLEQLFEPRFTTKDGTVRYGLGLGLPIARRIVEAHGGTITVRSSTDGTRAEVVLPLAGPPTGTTDAATRDDHADDTGGGP